MCKRVASGILKELVVCAYDHWQTPMEIVLSVSIFGSSVTWINKQHWFWQNILM